MVQLQRPVRPRRVAARLLLHVAGLAILCLMTSCGKDSSKNDGSGGGGGGSPGPSSAREKAASVENFLINYGTWDAAAIDIAKRYDVVVIHPSQGVTREMIEEIQKGVNPSDPSDDVVVLGYISIGEDLRTSIVT